ncbi:energy-coupling factor ABC transporter ATP-binding protein [Campylobacter fetus]|uniref:energy-coupling factor ABC transporter ATP-binding protein n=1 Tax=Campylobacter fetus TaxID=196 RepID=UPI0008189F9D|nr:ABC transporter ATP-binding protein [Campylobacter fetus]OCR93895.1 cobalt ABC transporter ATP-binding protein [Campylobacter fetus subsp. testudinum]
MSCTLSFKNISAKIGDRTLFSNLNLNAGHKDKISIIGSNGCGKTTLLEIIGGLRDPDSGEIEIFHNAILNLKEYQKYRHLIGYLFQNSDDQFICPNVFEDVVFGLLAVGVQRNIADKKAKEILQELDIWHLRDKIVFHLSGGEKKLVALAGVLVNEPQILLLDEPTAALDFDMQEKVADLLIKLDITQIIVSHDKEFISRVANKMYYLSKDGLRLGD